MLEGFIFRSFPADVRSVITRISYSLSVFYLYVLLFVLFLVSLSSVSLCSPHVVIFIFFLLRSSLNVFHLYIYRYCFFFYFLFLSQSFVPLQQFPRGYFSSFHHIRRFFPGIVYFVSLCSLVYLYSLFNVSFLYPFRPFIPLRHSNS